MCLGSALQLLTRWGISDQPHLLAIRRDRDHTDSRAAHEGIATRASPALRFRILGITPALCSSDRMRRFRTEGIDSSYLSQPSAIFDQRLAHDMGACAYMASVLSAPGVITQKYL